MWDKVVCVPLGDVMHPLNYYHVCDEYSVSSTDDESDYFKENEESSDDEVVEEDDCFHIISNKTRWYPEDLVLDEPYIEL